jgi:phosphatidylglycerol:prolipoprotein diacylglycerol transferase
MTLAAWLHDLDPYVIRFTDGFGLRWYGLSYVAGFVAAYFILRWMGSRELTPIKPERAGDVIVTLALGAVIGGRLGYIVFYEPSLLWMFQSGFPFWGVVMINHGGMSSHGGLIGAVVAGWLVARGYKDETGRRVGAMPLLHVADVSALIAAPGLLFGRLANFINGELLGRIVAMPGEPSPWWSVKFPQELLSAHAPQLSDVQYLQLAALRERAGAGLPAGEATARLIEQVQVGNAEFAQQLAPLIAARHPSQLYQALCDGIIAGLVVWWIWRRPRVPGVVGSWFLIGYGVLRIATEHWRLPDEHLEVVRMLGLTRGQWLSAAMIAVGVVALPILKKKGGQRFGGWGVKDPKTDA